MTAGNVFNPIHPVSTPRIHGDHVSAMSLDEAEVGNYCKQLNGVVEQYGIRWALGSADFEFFINEIKVVGIGNKLVCVVGVPYAHNKLPMARMAIDLCG